MEVELESFAAEPPSMIRACVPVERCLRAAGRLTFDIFKIGASGPDAWKGSRRDALFIRIPQCCYDMKEAWTRGRREALSSEGIRR